METKIFVLNRDTKKLTKWELLKISTEKGTLKRDIGLGQYLFQVFHKT